MADWVVLCEVDETPAEGAVAALEVGGRTVCLTRIGGTLCAVDGVCPHRGAPLAEGWLEGGNLVCPWHAWSFDLHTGQAEYPAGEQIAVFALKQVGEDVLIDLEGTEGSARPN